MSIAPVNTNQYQTYAGYEPVPVPAGGPVGAEHAFASYEAPQAPATAAFPHAGYASVARAAGGMSATPSSYETAQLQDKIATIKKAEKEVQGLVDRMRNDPSLGPKSEAAKRDGTFIGALDFVVSETKKSGLYDTLQKAAVERLKDSGNYEDLIQQVLQKEESLGRTRDRAWAEKWIERQFDYDSVDLGHVEGNLYFDLRADYGSARAMPGNKGSATFFGNKADVQARGAFVIEIGGSVQQPTYTVENTITGQKTPPRAFDPAGTVVEADGLRAEMFGVPAPGDQFSIYKPAADAHRESEYQVRYLDSFFMVSPRNRKIALFDSLFGPAIRNDGTSVSSPLILDALRTPV